MKKVVRGYSLALWRSRLDVKSPTFSAGAQISWQVEQVQIFLSLTRCQCLIWLHTSPSYAYAGYTERRKTQREARPVDIPAVTAEGEESLGAK
jgi:hypothetical protein